MRYRIGRSLKIAPALALAIAISLSPKALAKKQQEPSKATPTINPHELVAKAVANEVKSANDNFSMMYRIHRHTSKGEETKQYIETKDGTAGMTVAEDDKPLSPERQQQEFQRLEAIAQNPAEIQRKKRQQKEDSDRTVRMVRALPDAFTYQYESTETKNGDEMVRLKFQPNPSFDPPSRELQVFTGMHGFVVVDATKERIAEINGTLFKSVNFGWGILGHLDKGGRFVVVQGDVDGGYWTTTHMQLSFTGKALFFHSINIQSTEDSSDFHRVPNNLTYAQGINLLKKQESVVADNHAAGK